MIRPLLTACLIGSFALVATPAQALDDEHRAKAEAVAKKAVAFLRSSQANDGSWSPKAGPAVTAFATSALLRAGVPHDDPAVKKALDYILSKQKDNGGIYDQILANYNTSISLMALGLVRDKDPRYAEAVKKAQDFLVGLQWNEDKVDPDGERVTKDHRWYGGVGYGKHGRPDNSNLTMWAAGLKDSGYNCNSAAYQRIAAFVGRLQGSKHNTDFGDQIEPGGGAIYATSTDKDHIDKLETKAGTFIDEFGKSRLRTYGSMTYAMFMSFMYVELDDDSPQVEDAMKWIRNHYTLDQNPGMLDLAETKDKDERFQGYYYYLHLFARGLEAWTNKPDRPAEQRGKTTLTLANGKTVDWANDLIDKLAELQSKDGSWTNQHDRWMEGDPNLVTSYALSALMHAAH